MIAQASRLLVLAGKQLLRHRTRTLLTLLGVAAGMFLFTIVQTTQSAVDSATRIQASDQTLVVYRENRFCPETSRLPEHYLDEILNIPGVRGAIPIKIAVSNCGASLDVVTFRGVPRDTLSRYAPEITVTEGSYASWYGIGDGALIGRQLAQRRGLKVGDSFDAAGIRATVSGIVDSPNPQDVSVAYVDLPFLQQASGRGLGEVTQFNVRVEPGTDLDAVARAIDARFKAESDPTYTQPEKAFVAQTAGALLDLVGFTRWLGYGAVLAVLGLIANAVLLIVRGRVREHAILHTLGYPGIAIAFLVAIEGALLGLLGGGLGVGGAVGFLRWRRLIFGNEGLTLALLPDTSVLTAGLAVSLLLGALAALWPAWTAARRPIVESLRS